MTFTCTDSRRCANARITERLNCYLNSGCLSVNRPGPGGALTPREDEEHGAAPRKYPDELRFSIWFAKLAVVPSICQ